MCQDFNNIMFAQKLQDLTLICQLTDLCGLQTSVKTCSNIYLCEQVFAKNNMSLQGLFKEKNASQDGHEESLRPGLYGTKLPW